MLFNFAILLQMKILSLINLEKTFFSTTFWFYNTSFCYSTLLSCCRWAEAVITKDNTCNSEVPPPRYLQCNTCELLCVASCIHTNLYVQDGGAVTLVVGSFTHQYALGLLTGPPYLDIESNCDTYSGFMPRCVVIAVRLFTSQSV